MAKAQFPLYRRYKHGRTWFKVTGEDTCWQLDIIGNYYSYQQFKAVAYPEKQYLHQMIHQYEEYWEEADEREFETTLKKCRLEKTLIE